MSSTFRSAVGSRDPQAQARDLHEALSRRDAASGRDPASDRLSPEETAAIDEHFDCFRAVVALNVLNERARNDLSLLPVFFCYYECAFSGKTEHFDIRGIDAALAHAAQSLKQCADRFHEISREPSTESGLATQHDLQTTFELVRRALNRTVGLLVEADRENFDEASYLTENPDVAAAVARGAVKSGYLHFLSYGESEKRKLRLFAARADERPESLVHPIDFVKCGASCTGVGRAVEVELLDWDTFFTRSDRPISLTVLHDNEAYDSSASLHESSVGRGLEAFGVWSSRLSWSTGQAYLASFRDATADIVNGIVLSGAKAWGDSCFATLLCAGGLRRSPDFFQIGGDFARITRADREQRLTIDTPVMICCTWASLVNYGHWLMNTLMSVYLVLDELKAGRLRLLCPPLSERQRAELLEIGVPPDAIIETRARMVLCDRLIYPSPLTTLANTNPSSLAVEFFDFLKRRFPCAAERPAHAHVFLTRKGFPSARIMVDEDRLIAALAEYGFECIAPHEMSLAEQIHALSRAKIVVGQFGAALWNTPFMPRGATLVEISTTNYVSNEYLYASHLTGHQFVRVMTEPLKCSGVASEGGTFTFQAPVQAVSTIVRGLLAEPDDFSRFDHVAR